MNKKYIKSPINKPPTFEYLTLCDMLGELFKKVQETNDTGKIKLYCELFEKLYKLLESKGDKECI